MREPSFDMKGKTRDDKARSDEGDKGEHRHKRTAGADCGSSVEQAGKKERPKTAVRGRYQEARMNEGRPGERRGPGITVQ